MESTVQYCTFIKLHKSVYYFHEYYAGSSILPWLLQIKNLPTESMSVGYWCSWPFMLIGYLLHVVSIFNYMGNFNFSVYISISSRAHCRLCNTIMFRGALE
ncbi:hypothetical protein VPH35_101451 [Triticum aestivum]|uniref:Uncharacterized protein n=1 Tax=Aegilops tauschii subsp. strangulata TaxID=200361 RepID=A0A453MFG0_AEGTS